MEKLVQEHYYLELTLSFENPPDFALDRRQLKVIILHALRTLHGQVGAAIPVDIIKCNENEPASTMRAVLRVPNRELVKLWSGLTLLGSYGERTCAFHITKLSASLMSLAVDSRHFLFDGAENGHS